MRLMVTYLVAQGKKGLHEAGRGWTLAVPVAARPSPGGLRPRTTDEGALGDAHADLVTPDEEPSESS